MQLFLVICFAAVVEAGYGDDAVGWVMKMIAGMFIDFGNEEEVHVTKPDSGEPTEIRNNPNLGDEIKIPRAGSENPSEGAEIYIPSNRVPVNRDKRV